MRQSLGLMIAAGLLTFAALLFALTRLFPGALADENNLMRFVYSVVLLSALLMGFASNARGSAGQLLRQAVVWAGIFLMVIVGYTYRDDFGSMFQRVRGEVAPSQPISAGNSVYLTANQSGHFEVEALVNNRRVNFMVDTGATSVSLTRRDAKRLGIKLDKLTYNLPYNTANGIIYKAPVTLRVVQIGKIVISNVPATVPENDRLRQSLLGMSYLNKLRGFSVNKNTLELRQ